MEVRDETEREAEAVAVVLLSILFGGLVLFFSGWSFEAVKVLTLFEWLSAMTSG